MEKPLSAPGRFLCAERCERRARASRIKLTRRAFVLGATWPRGARALESVLTTSRLGVAFRKRSLNFSGCLPLSVSHLSLPFKWWFTCFNTLGSF